MYIPFEKLHPQSRIWIYQAGKFLTNADEDIISAHLRAFTDEWTVHGAPLDASFDIRFNRFVILAANDQTSGCSIDSSVRIIKEVGTKIGVDFFDRSAVAFKDGDHVSVVSQKELKDAFANGSLTADSVVFNNLVETLRDLNERWLLPAGETWLKRYINKPQIV